MRLAAQAKMGYYPTPDSVTPIIARHLRRQREGLIRIFDPCAGQGTAIRIIGEHLTAEKFGVELDLERGARAKEILTKCLVTDYKNTRISHNFFSLLWLNPPYDWEARDSDFETPERYEKSFLRDCIPYLCSNGVLVYLIPQKRLDSRIAKILSYRFHQISVFRFPEEEYRAFKQIVLFLTYSGTMQTRLMQLMADKLTCSLAIEGELSDKGLAALSESSDSLAKELTRMLLEKADQGGETSLKDIWAVYRKKEVQVELTIQRDLSDPAPEAVTISKDESEQHSTEIKTASTQVDRIGDRVVKVQFIEHTGKRKKKVTYIEVREAALEEASSEMFAIDRSDLTKEKPAVSR